MNTQTMYPPTVGGFAHGLAMKGYHLMLEHGMNDDWEIDEWSSDGSYDYNIYKPDGYARLTVDVYELKDDEYGFLDIITESMFTYITVERNEHGVYTWRNHHNNYNIKESK